MEGKIAVLGDTDFVMPFSALGVDTFAVEQTPAEIAENARKIVEENYALVVVAENIAQKAEEVFADYRDKPTENGHRHRYFKRINEQMSRCVSK
jgi:vacuolar-type H+-ATPase subunit F/Vma7